MFNSLKQNQRKRQWQVHICAGSRITELPVRSWGLTKCKLQNNTIQTV